MKRKDLRISKVSGLLVPQIYENKKRIPSLFHWYVILKMAWISAVCMIREEKNHFLVNWQFKDSTAK